MERIIEQLKKNISFKKMLIKYIHIYIYLKEYMWIKINPTQPDNLYDFHDETIEKFLLLYLSLIFALGYRYTSLGLTRS